MILKRVSSLLSIYYILHSIKALTFKKVIQNKYKKTFGLFQNQNRTVTVTSIIFVSNMLLLNIFIVQINKYYHTLACKEYHTNKMLI